MIKGGKNKKSPNVIYAIILSVIGLVLLVFGYLVTNNIINFRGDFVEVTASVKSYIEQQNGNVNVMCNYKYNNKDYDYICYGNITRQVANQEHKIGSTQTIKINKDKPEEIMMTSSMFSLLFIIGMIFVIAAMIYLILEIRRLTKK